MAGLSTQAIYNLFQSLYGEGSSRHFDTTAWAPRIMSDVIEEMAEEFGIGNAEFLGSTSTDISVVANTREYNLPAGLVEILKVERVEGAEPYDRLTPIDFRDIGSRPSGPYLVSTLGGGTGEPWYYYVRGKPQAAATASALSVIGFEPIPSAAATIRVWYVQRLAAITTIDGTTYPDLPEDAHRLVAYRMAVHAAKSDGSPMFMAHVGEWNSALERYQQKSIKGRGEESAEVMEYTDEDL